MSSHFATAGALLSSLAANGVSDGDLDRLVSRGLVGGVADAISSIIAADRAAAREEHDRWMKVKAAGVERLQELSGVPYESLDFLYLEMVELLGHNGVERIGQFTKVSRADLHQFGLPPEQSLYIGVALEALGLSLA